MSRTSILRAWKQALLLAGLALALAACGNKEAEQRGAFVQFLQTRVLDKPGVRVPKPSEEQQKSFGDYAQHYAVIADFNEGMNQSVSQPMNAILARGAIRSLSDVIARRDDLKGAKEGVSQMRAALETQLAKADAARAALKQPDDLKAVYDKAYERTVTQPATTFKEVFPAMDAVFDGALKLADYLQQNKSKITLSGSSAMVSDPAVQKEVNAMMQDMNKHSAAINEAQRKLQAMVRGS